MFPEEKRPAYDDVRNTIVIRKPTSREGGREIMTDIEKIQSGMEQLGKAIVGLMSAVDKLNTRITALEQLRQAQRDGKRARERVEAQR